MKSWKCGHSEILGNWLSNGAVKRGVTVRMEISFPVWSHSQRDKTSLSFSFLACMQTWGYDMITPKSPSHSKVVEILISTSCPRVHHTSRVLLQSGDIYLTHSAGGREQRNTKGGCREDDVTKAASILANSGLCFCRVFSHWSSDVCWGHLVAERRKCCSVTKQIIKEKKGKLITWACSFKKVVAITVPKCAKQ